MLEVAHGEITSAQLSHVLAAAQEQQYFERVCSAKPPPKVSFGEQLIRVYTDTAINSGIYTFAAVIQGQPRSLPARYSFAYRKVDGRWLIADHHSSALPSPPPPPASAPAR